MRVFKNEKGLYEIDIIVEGEKKSKNLKGLVDTGSTHCACTYEVITTLQIRPIEFATISTIDQKKFKALAYITDFEFDGKKDLIQIYRVNNLPEGIQFIVGMEFLQNCSITMTDSYMDITLEK